MHRNASKSSRNSSRRLSPARGRVSQSTPSPTTRQRYDLRRVDNVSCEAVSAAQAPDSTIEETVPGSYGTHALDLAFKANLARLTNGISPAGMMSLYVDWLAHLALSPGKQLRLVEKAARK